ncbi:MAG: hypothetical protein A2887_03870 [Alphaproteobacteria bacterium RIFCSPLOWO2_01_FULL_40_26]|nr:MAG: hypothetical protein A3D15_05025 [Alphaproteobacteria bacterium RIFCSPHIGHO2_02_FULL_40_34]OFW87984.1 MAG: hypothetical protein A2794_00770 [Alphaproteobacteria bacterium RIFCSPHIGHO2_01_FULL_40_8]OFW95335.1 MAG: hypothetical protein A2887_03870 [Alphaproteobacteria bacterium RIFCSPLOWO2_01_FULL_40_26]OFX09238.1 MAG: hypothetical protein A3H30_06575 [Alphaproteobacteria bacterium RIFCSPLOWO2_02_FULL_40_19]OFX11593.1 MAG: hypothetical protein A3G22_05180 [Alphaproteobacteria bacterium RI
MGLKKILDRFLFYDYLNGNFAYKNYINHQKEYHPQEKILDKKTFLRQLRESKWHKINRCC